MQTVIDFYIVVFFRLMLHYVCILLLLAINEYIVLYLTETFHLLWHHHINVLPTCQLREITASFARH